MKCPRCDTALLLVAASESVDPPPKRFVIPRFRIIDLLGVTALVALHLAAFPIAAGTSDAEWPLLLYFTPTLITCLLHLRLRLGVPIAMLTHYVATFVWAFVHSLGQNAAINAYNKANPTAGRDYQLDLIANAWSDAGGTVVVGLVWAGVYGLICYTAISANQCEAV